MSLRVLRVKNSGYFPRDFNEKEKKRLGLEYALGDFDLGHDIVLITNTDTSSEEILELNKKHKIKLIVHPNSGYDNFSVSLLQKLDCPFLLGNPIRANAVAEYIISCFTHHYALKFQTSWNRDQSKSQRKLMSASKVLVFGKGHIGQILDKKLKELVEKIDFYDPYRFDSDYRVEDYDAIILACGLNAQNDSFINREFLKKLKLGSVVINAARGGLINWDAIEDSKGLSFYIDVFPNEPFELEKYQESSNLFLTSHLAGCHQDLVESILDFEEQVIKDFLSLESDSFQEKYHDLEIRNKIINGELI